MAVVMAGVTQGSSSAPPRYPGHMEQFTLVPWTM